MGNCDLTIEAGDGCMRGFTALFGFFLFVRGNFLQQVLGK
jgi:hypothetical protein